MGQRCLGTLLLAVGLGSRRAGRGSNIRSFAFVAVSNARKHPPTGAELAKKRETPIVSGPFEEIEKAPKYRLVGLKLPRTSGRFFMAMVQSRNVAVRSPKTLTPVPTVAMLSRKQGPSSRLLICSTGFRFRSFFRSPEP